MNELRKTCAQCGAELADEDVRGLCPRCLLHAGLASQTDPNATVAVAGGSGRSRALGAVARTSLESGRANFLQAASSGSAKARLSAHSSPVGAPVGREHEDLGPCGDPEPTRRLLV